MSGRQQVRATRSWRRFASRIPANLRNAQVADKYPDYRRDYFPGTACTVVQLTATEPPPNIELRGNHVAKMPRDLINFADERGNSTQGRAASDGVRASRASQPATMGSRRAFAIVAIALLATLACAQPVHAQSQESQPSPLISVGSSDDSKPVPIFSAGMGFITPFEAGSPHLDPLISPVILIPLGNRWLIESRDTFESDLAQPPGSGNFRGFVKKEVDYFQVDYIASPYLTVTAGRYLTPFGIFNERLYPIWIRDLQSDPLILPIGVGPSNAGTGGMLRGGVAAGPKIRINYAAYFSTLSTMSPVDSDRFAGIRLGIYLPGPRFEFGGSFQHLLQQERSNSFGFHFAWQPPRAPLDVRGEYARSIHGSGYWVESAYRLRQAPFWNEELRRTQVVARAQQFFVGTVPATSVLPVNTQQVEFGLNYYFRDDLRAVSSYGRQFTSLGNENIWTVGVTYRFVVPIGRAEAGGGNN